MANQFFKNFPEIQYTLNTGKIITIKDFFRKSALSIIKSTTVGGVFCWKPVFGNEIGVFIDVAPAYGQWHYVEIRRTSQEHHLVSRSQSMAPRGDGSNIGLALFVQWSVLLRAKGKTSDRTFRVEGSVG